MKVLIIADVHGDTRLLKRVIDAESDANAIIFLGDGIQDMAELYDQYTLPRTYLVRGNCDFSCMEPSEALGGFGGVLVFYTHGNGYDVKWTTSGLKSAARARGADVALFGHTHIPYYEYDDGLYLFNPGALSRSSTGVATYGIMQVNDGVPDFSHKEINND
ncbi:MAG: metallophosphoesterase [Oscillospiraceae bacterium]